MCGSIEEPHITLSVFIFSFKNKTSSLKNSIYYTRALGRHNVDVFSLQYYDRAVLAFS